MILKNRKTGGLFKLINHSHQLHHPFVQDKVGTILTIAWNTGPVQTLDIDGQTFESPHNSIVALMANQTFKFHQPENVVAWQFNRQFYCIVDHDEEVSCLGLLFYGSADHPFITLDALEARKIDLLYQVFVDEFEENDGMQEEMLRMLLKRLIIKVTRLYKQQVNLSRLPVEELDLVRQYNWLVENKYKVWHQVQNYANEMNKSPKTLSNLFAQYNIKSPLKIIHERIVLEAKRMLIYTDSSVKEIAYELGFEEVPPFNRLFKKVTQLAPTKFRNAVAHKQLEIIV